jgi:hypothetical protein
VKGGGKPPSSKGSSKGGGGGASDASYAYEEDDDDDYDEGEEADVFLLQNIVAIIGDFVSNYCYLAEKVIITLL